MNTGSWISSQVAKLLPHPAASPHEAAAVNTSRQAVAPALDNGATEAVKVTTTQPGAPRSTHERLNASLTHKGEASSPRELRRLLEGRCAFEAARKATDADLAVLQTLHERLEKHARARRITDYYATNYTIHEAIITLAGNRWLAQVIGDLRKILKLARLQSLRAAGRMDQSLNEHLAVFAALKARDSEGAEAAMRTHLTRQREALRELARSQHSKVAA